MPKPRRTHQPNPISVRIGETEIIKTGASRFDLRDPYHLAVTLRWPHFFLALLAIDLAINIVFGLLYMAQPGSIANAQPGSFGDAFFFSIETLATVGYGVMAPLTLYGHVISSLEILCGMTFTAIMTGLIFVRFSKPRAKIVFADHPVMSHYNGRPTLMIRIGNRRLSPLVDASVRLTAFLLDRSTEGQVFRRPLELRLAQSRLPIFAVTWTLMHEIDETSPLFGYSQDRMIETRVRFFLAVEARDHLLGAHVYDLKDYAAADILFGMRYQDAATFDEQGRVHADLTRVSLTEADGDPAPHPGGAAL